MTHNQRSPEIPGRFILLDQLRSVDKRRLAGKMGEIELSKWHPVLMEMLS